MDFIAFFRKLFSNQRGAMQTATKTRTATSTRVKVAVTVGMIGLVAAAAYGFAFAPGFQVRRAPVALKVNVPLTTRTNTPTPPPGGAGGGTGDTRAPLVGVVKPVVAQTGTPVTLTATFSDTDTGVTSCELTVDGTSVGTMTLSTITGGAGTASRSFTFTTAGAHTASVACTDAAVNTGNSGIQNITVSTAPDTTPPTVGTVSPATATQALALSISATFTDNVGVTGCTLTVDGTSVGPMTLGTITAGAGTASRSYTFSAVGLHTAKVICTDAVGNIGSSVVRTITVSAAVARAEDCGDITVARPSFSPSGVVSGSDDQTVAIWTLTASRNCTINVQAVATVSSGNIVVTHAREAKLWTPSSAGSDNLFATGIATASSATSTLNVAIYGTKNNLRLTTSTPVSIYLTADTQDAGADDTLRTMLERLDAVVSGGVPRPIIRWIGLPIAGNDLSY